MLGGKKSWKKYREKYSWKNHEKNSKKYDFYFTEMKKKKAKMKKVKTN